MTFRIVGTNFVVLASILILAGCGSAKSQPRKSEAATVNLAVACLDGSRPKCDMLADAGIKCSLNSRIETANQRCVAKNRRDTLTICEARQVTMGLKHSAAASACSEAAKLDALCDNGQINVDSYDCSRED